MVIVVGNGHGDSSSNHGREWLHFTKHYPYPANTRNFILLITGCPVWKSYKISFVKTVGMITRSPYINMPLRVENKFFVLTFSFINSFLLRLMNLSNFALNFISSCVTGSSLTVLNKKYFTSISDIYEAITVSSSSSVLFGINLDNPYACEISFDGKNSILNESFNSTAAHLCKQFAMCVCIPFLKPNIVNNGRWSVCNTNSLQFTYLWDLLIANIIPKASFSICK